MAATNNMNRSQAQSASGLNLLAAIWLFISAFVVPIHGPMTTNNVIFGICVAVLAVIRLGGAYDQSWLSWLNALLGVWVVISPWAVIGAGQGGPTNGMIVNNCITGGVIFVLGCWSALATNSAPGETPYRSSPSFGR